MCDPGRLDTEEAIANLPDLSRISGGVSQICAQISDKTCQNVSQAGESHPKKSKLQTLGNECVSRAVAGAVALGQMVRAAGFEPATPSV